ncbi:DUF2070 family protein [Thermogladius sp. 4427co]|uniref:DUF2070 family protein n=1 Tax=Thermogladius sp. 4427co TaxID=3450718 RepID=UPI003F7ACABD
MKLYKPRSSVSRYYTVLFSLPHWRLLAGVIILLLATVILLMGSSSEPYITYFTVVLALLYIYSRLYGKTVFWKTKRILGLSLTALIYVLLYGFILGDWRASVVASASLLSVVILGLDGTSLWRYSIPVAGSTLSIVLYEFIHGVKKVSLIAYSLAGSILVSLVDYVIYKYINRRKVGGVGSADIGTLFMKNWLDKDSSIESFFNSVASERETELVVLKSGSTILLSTNLHYGPFSNIGGSLLPELVESTFSRDYNMVVLHGFGGHDRDIPSREEATRVLGALRRLVTERDSIELLYHGSFELETEKGWRIVGLVFDKLVMLFVSRPCCGTDDLPYSFYLKYSSIFESRLGSKLILVESHNREAEKKPSTEGLDEALRKSVELVEGLKKKEPVKTLVRSVTQRIVSPGVIGGVFRMIEVKGIDGRDPVLLVYFRGNNMAPGVRDSIINKLKESYSGIIEVVTNDEHTETGVRAHVTYIPVHVDIDRLGQVEEGLRKLLETTYSEGLEMSSTRITVKLLNNAAYELEYLLRKSYLETSILLVLYVFVVSPMLSKILIPLFS